MCSSGKVLHHSYVLYVKREDYHSFKSALVCNVGILVEPPLLCCIAALFIFLSANTSLTFSRFVSQVLPSWDPSWPAVPLTPLDLPPPPPPPPTGLDPIQGLPLSGSPIHMKVRHTRTNTQTCMRQPRVLNPGSWFGIRLRCSH